MATFVNDTFTGTDGTTLASHTPDDGGTWQITSTAAAGGSSSGVTAILSSGTLTANAPGLQSSLYRHSASPATAEYDITAEFIIGTTSTSNDYWNLVGRLTATGTTDSVLSRYCASYRGAGTGWRILKNINGTATVLAQAATSVTGTKSVKFEIRNATKTLYVDGVSTVSTTDNTITQVGKVGLGAPDDQSVNSIDNLLAADPASSTVSGTAASVLPALTQSATGTFTAPTYTGSAASTLPAFTTTASGTFTPPVYTGTATSTLPAFTTSGSGTFTAPVYNGSAASVLPSFAQTATGTFTAPVYTGTATSTLPGFTSLATGTFTSPVYTGEAASVLPALSQAAEGTFFIPVPITPRGPYYATLTASRQLVGSLTARQTSGVLTASRQVSGELTD